MSAVIIHFSACVQKHADKLAGLQLSHELPDPTATSRKCTYYLQVYLTWIPLAYIFNTDLLEILLALFPRAQYRNPALQCLTEIGALPEVGDEHNDMFRLLFQHFMSNLVQVLPPTLDIAQVRSAGLLLDPAATVSVCLPYLQSESTVTSVALRGALQRGSHTLGHCCAGSCCMIA